MAESIVRGRKKGYTVLYNSALQDDRLSLRTLGLFALMQSFPDDWSYSVRGLAQRARVSRDIVHKCLVELEECGYLLREQAHGAGGKFAGNVYALQDESPLFIPSPLPEISATVRAEKAPLPKKPSTVEPSTVKPSTDFSAQQNKQVSNYSSKNNPPISPQGGRGTLAQWKPERFEAFWAYYRTHVRGEARQKAVKAWDKLKPSDELIAIMGKALTRQVASEEWQRGIGRPYASTWLNGRRWEDEAPAPRGRDVPEAAPEVYGWQ